MRDDTREIDMRSILFAAALLLAVPATAPAQSQSEPAAARIAALEARIAALESRLAALESGGIPAAGLPSDEEFERGLGYMERFFRSFIGIVREFEDERAPNRT
jgi:hypothetical protein